MTDAAVRPLDGAGWWREVTVMTGGAVKAVAAVVTVMTGAGWRRGLTTITVITVVTVVTVVTLTAGAGGWRELTVITVVAAIMVETVITVVTVMAGADGWREMAVVTVVTVITVVAVITVVTVITGARRGLPRSRRRDDSEMAVRHILLAIFRDLSRSRLVAVSDSECNSNTGRRGWEADEPWQALAACIELDRAMRGAAGGHYPDLVGVHDDGPETSPAAALGGGGAVDPTRYATGFPLHVDGTCNGLQVRPRHRDGGGGVSHTKACLSAPVGTTAES